MDFIEVCRRVIGIDSTPSHGNLEMARYAGELCQAAGLHTELQTETLNGIEQANLIARPGSSIPERELMLQNHLDTVDPGAYSLWNKTGANPFNASIYGDELYGLGAAEVKLDFLCKLKAIEELGTRQWRLPFVLVGTYGEELGMAGAIKLVRKKKISAHMALIGEATDMRLVHASKGIAGVEITIPFSDEELAYQKEHNLSESTSTQSKIFSGKAAHSSTPHLGDNAIVKMLQYLAQLPTGLAVMGLDGGVNFNTVPAYAVLEIDLVGNIHNSIGAKISQILSALNALESEFASYPDEGFMPATPTWNIGMVRTYKDCIVLSGNCRWPPSASNAVYESWMERLRQTCQSAGASFHIIEYKQPFATDLKSELVRGCRDELASLGLDASCGKQSTSSEANVFNRLGIACVVIGPGRSEENVHTPQEHVSMEQLRVAVEFYKRILMRFCL